MKASLDLFNLVHSLSKTEKGYFKKFASLHTIGSENKYVQLFDIVEKQKTYNEKKAVQAIGLQNKTKNFAVLKSYLYGLILKSLRLYHSNSTVELELKETSEYIEILYNKGLYSQCNKLINKGILLAQKYELFLPLAEFLMWKLDIMHLQVFYGTNKEEVRKEFENVFTSLRKHEKIVRYKYLISLGIVERKSIGFARKEEELAYYSTLAKHELFKDETQLDSFLSATHYHIWHTVYSFTKHDYEGAYIHSKKLVAHINNNPWQKKSKPRNYSTALYNLLITQVETERFKEAAVTLEELKNTDAPSETVKQWLFYATNTIELNMLIQLGEFDKGLSLVPKIESYLKKDEGIPKEQEMTFYYNMALIYFGKNNFSKANYYLNKIIHKSSLDLRSDVHCFARIMSLIVHTEIGNSDLLEYTIKSTYRFLYKRNKLYQLEALILNFIKKNMFSKNTSEKHLNKSFENLIDDINKIKKDPFEKKALHYFDFVSWLESRIRKKNFALTVKEKAKRFNLQKT